MARACTLYEYLIRPNPEIQLQQSLSKSKTNTHTKSVNYPIPSYIQKWTEFNAKTVKRLFNQRLQQILTTEGNFHDFSHIHPSYCKVFDEDSLEALLVKSNQSILLESLENTSQMLVLQNVSMVRGGQAQLYHCWRELARADPEVRRNRAKVAGKWHPDWAGLVDVHGYNNILPGDTKLSRNWKSSELSPFIGRMGQGNLRGHPEAPALWPIRQVLHYCINSHMRYGYVITDEELVVMRVRPNEEYNHGATMDELHSTTWDYPFVEFQSIPWKQASTKIGLSVNLALYTLLILAANNGLLDWEYGSLDQEKLPTTKPQLSLCDEYPSFSTSEEYSQEKDPSHDSHDRAAPATSSSSLQSLPVHAGPSRKRHRSSPRHREENDSHKKSKN
ncbi:hypothetical protein O1611_g890 [Lasiodiplodia mahajangana]|uniref:Uncharacterized protein n=1 Tax=Lasiodiplodia mahajangana TaxID=1108764 RepID=A0ACC2JZN3_9PEZI|nr:hypothetical protein O1611_g890 [Lasiodiplodia mahajangana]